MHTPGRSDPRRWTCVLLAVGATVLAAVLPTAAASGANGFAFDLYAQLRSAEGNVFVSPFSVRTALAMTHAGARGETEAQLRRVLRLDGEGDAADLEALAGDGEAFRVANRLWGERTYDFLPGFVERIGDAYGGGLELVDFRTDPERSRSRINAWVEESTAGRIVDLLPPGAVDADTRLAIVNAVVFRGLWARPFDPALTHEEPFHRDDGSTVPVPLMGFGTPPRLPYFAGDGMRAIELAYGDGGFSMLVVLPEHPGDLAALEDRLDEETLDRVVAGLRPHHVDVRLPRFTVIWGTVDLTTALAGLGMGDLFRPGHADLSGIDGRRDLFVSGVFHQAFVAVDEAGTEAAAATAAVLMPTSAALPPPPVVFRADRPFLFLIRAPSTGEVVFLGRLVDPGRR